MSMSMRGGGLCKDVSIPTFPSEPTTPRDPFQLTHSDSSAAAVLSARAACAWTASCAVRPWRAKWGRDNQSRMIFDDDRSSRRLAEKIP